MKHQSNNTIEDFDNNGPTFPIYYSDMAWIKTNKGILILSPEAKAHILEWHWPESTKIGKTKFKTEQEIYDILVAEPFLEQIWWTQEYRWWDYSNKYNITARKTDKDSFSVITMFRKQENKQNNSKTKHKKSKKIQ